MQPELILYVCSWGSSFFPLTMECDNMRECAKVMIIGSALIYTFSGKLDAVKSKKKKSKHTAYKSCSS